MTLSRSSCFRILDGSLLAAVFVGQSIILSQYTVYVPKSIIPEDESPCMSDTLQKLLWLIGDLTCVTFLLLACLFGLRHLRNEKESPEESEGEPAPGNETSDRVIRIQRLNSFLEFILSRKFPLCYVSWFMYSAFMTIKICVIFTSSNVMTKLQQGEILGGQYLQLGIAMSAIIFSLLIEAHHDAGKDDPKRNAYLNSVAFGIALEILDTASLLSFLMVTFDHIEGHNALKEICPAASLTGEILAMSAFNLMLPTILLYKLTTTRFGEVYHVKLEMIFKIFHLVLVNLPYLVARIHLWNVNDREEVIFALKNLYGIVNFFRGIYSDVQLLKEERRRSALESPRNRREPGPSSPGNKKGDEENIVEMKSLMSAGVPEVK